MLRPGVFVNYGGFTLELPTADATSFQADEQTRFWGQLDQYQRVSVLAEGDLTIVVTRDVHAWRQVSDWVESALDHPDLAP